MKSSHAPHATAFAAFLLGALIALLLAAPARSAETFRLDRLGIVRFSASADGRLLQRYGVLLLDGQVQWRATLTIERPADVPEWALDRDLVAVNAWLAYYRLGGAATANFEVQLGAVRAVIGDQAYYAVGVSPAAAYASGRVINLSMRVRLADGEGAAIAGFVVEARPRTVLIRAVGPGLVPLGVADALPDPRLSLLGAGTPLGGNDDWSRQAAGPRIARVAARVGAFPLAEGSADAAQLVTLPPGAYTVKVDSPLPLASGREVLIEVYDVPEEFLD